jgi:hypothetical protein
VEAERSRLGATPARAAQPHEMYRVQWRDFLDAQDRDAGQP